jgi:hypothetical protein
MIANTIKIMTRRQRIGWKKRVAFRTGGRSNRMMESANERETKQEKPTTNYTIIPNSIIHSIKKLRVMF